MSGNFSKKRNPARSLALVGIMAAAVECGKLALAFIPNVEVVSILLALFGYVFGWHGIVAALVFVAIEPMIWGFNTWVISYIIYWPLVAAVFMLLSKLKIKNRFAITGISVLLTAFFGVLTSLVDVGLFSGSYENFWYRFGVYYARGVGFYAIHIASNAVIFLSLFPLLEARLRRIKSSVFSL